MTGSSSSIPTFGIPPHRKAVRHHIGGARFCAALEKNWKKRLFGRGLVDGSTGCPAPPQRTPNRLGPSTLLLLLLLSVCLSLVPRQRRDKNLPHPHRMLLFHIILYYSAHTSCRPTKCAVNERPPLHQFTTVFKVKREYLISRRQLENL